MDTFFYTSILGGVIFGIDVALSLERWGTPMGIRGLLKPNRPERRFPY